MAVDKIGRTYKRKSAASGIIWFLIGAFALYTIYCVGITWWKAIMFKRDAHKIASTDVLGGRFSDDFLVSELLSAADYNGVYCDDSDIDIIEQGRRRQVDIRFDVPFEYFTYRSTWHFKTRCVGWEDVGRPVYK